jgi:threonine-phosphate decarboxylase
MTGLHGGEIEWVVSEEFGIPMSKIVSFANTVSPIIPPEIKNLSRRFGQLFLYPPRDPKHLRGIVADYEEVSPENVILGSGSTELIHLFARVFGSGKVVIPVPTYSEYETAVSANGGSPRFVSPLPGFRLDAKDVVDEVKGAKAVMVCNPNNPTGRLYPRSALLDVARAAKRAGAMLFIDEVYMCFAPPSKEYTLCEFIESYPVFILNSISKLFGVPSLRLGWGVASKATIRRMAAHKSPGTIGNLSIWAAEELLVDKGYQGKINSYIEKEKARFIPALKKTGVLTPHESDCNFILSQVTGRGWNSTKLFRVLAAEGLVIRDCASIRGLGNRYVRTTVRTAADNDRLIGALGHLGGRRA